MMRILVILMVFIATSTLGFAVDTPDELLPNPTQEQRAEKIGAEIRCLVCQNESIEDSSAPLARDLRRIVRQQVAQGKSDRDILSWMTARYGDFIRLKPRLTIATLLLWLTPVIGLLFGCFFASRAFLRREESPPLNAQEREALTRLLDRDASQKARRSRETAE